MELSWGLLFALDVGDCMPLLLVRINSFSGRQKYTQKIYPTFALNTKSPTPRRNTNTHSKKKNLKPVYLLLKSAIMSTTVDKVRAKGCKKRGASLI